MPTAIIATGNDSADPMHATDGTHDGLTANPAGDLRVIELLLDREDLSEETRDDLRRFRDDIQERRMTEMDGRYLRALASRLGL